jgi:hypothetical protein
MISDGPIRRDAKCSLDLRVKISKLPFRATQAQPRHFAAGALYEITSEHHSSITLMLLHRRSSSAQALLRPCIEASIRTLWLLRCVSDEQFDDFQKTQGWPGLEQIIGKVEGVYRKGGFLRKLIPKRDTLNDLTHGGFLTIADRLYPFMAKNDAALPSAERAQEIVAALCIRIADRMLCLAATAMHTEFGNLEAAVSIKQAYISALAVYELRQPSEN